MPVNRSLIKPHLRLSVGFYWNWFYYLKFFHCTINFIIFYRLTNIPIVLWNKLCPVEILISIFLSTHSFKCRTRWNIYWNQVHPRLNWYSAFLFTERLLLLRIEIRTKLVLHLMELDWKDRTLSNMVSLDTMRCAGLNNHSIKVFEKLLKINFHINRSAKKSLKINQVLINGLNDGTT